MSVDVVLPDLAVHDQYDMNFLLLLSYNENM